MKKSPITSERETLVRVDGVSKKFCKSLKRSLWYGVEDITSEMMGLSRRNEVRKDEFWAVQDINFELQRGDCLGLIGHNGAGKSTLLKMLNGLIKPDKGRIEMHGRVGALIELGTGFNPILTGRENIYNNAAVLGFSKTEVNQKFDEIVEFSEIGEFIDSPVQNYSSGMKVRLGFAVAAQLEPDILIIDEVLAVGDMKFKLKCYNKIDEIAGRTTVIFVSHSMPQISRLCDSILLMKNGQSSFYGTDISKGIDTYYNSVDLQLTHFSKNNNVKIIKCDIITEEFLNGTPLIEWNSDFQLDLELKILEVYRDAVISISIFDKEQRPIGICQEETPLSRRTPMFKKGGFNVYKISLTIRQINLSQGLYFVSIMINEGFRNKPLLRLQSFKSFQIKSKNSVWPPIEFKGEWN